MNTKVLSDQAFSVLLARLELAAKSAVEHKDEQVYREVASPDDLLLVIEKVRSLIHEVEQGGVNHVV